MTAARVDVLIEVGVEELPAGSAPKLAAALGEALAATLQAAGLVAADAKPTVLGTPRRLVAHFAQVLAQQEESDEELLGPPARVAFDAEGKPTRAAEGFARGLGVEASALIRVATDKGEYAALRRRLPGRPLAELVGAALPLLIADLPCPKKMRWGRERTGFLRPVQWLVALAGDAVISCRFADVEAGRVSRGHRFYGEVTGAGPAAFEGQALTLHAADLEAYCDAMRAAFVMVDPAERRDKIDAEARACATAAGGTLVEDAATLETVTWLTEWPTPLLGAIEPSLLRIPDAVTRTTLRDNQKLFTVMGPEGRLLPRFVATANTLHPGCEATIAAGNARVVSARMADAAFFYDSDREQKLADFLPKLEGRTFLEGLGSTAAKVARIEALSAKWLSALPLSEATRATVPRAAALCKADLASKMVFEFPELQGTIGEDYARSSGETAEVARAIAEHYLPRGADDGLPTEDAGAVVGLADRLDTIAACFALRLLPSGSNDPYALRRAALAVLRLLAGRSWRVPLTTLIADAIAGLPAEAFKAPASQLQSEITDFFRGRLRSWLGDFHAPDTAEAVLEVDIDDVPALFERAAALTAFRAHPEFAALAAGFKRIANLARKADAADLGAVVEPSRFETAAEAGLLAAIAAVEAEVAAATARRDWQGALLQLASLRPAVDAFFDGVMVMAEDPGLRRNRLALLGRAAGLFARLADFSRVQQA